MALSRLLRQASRALTLAAIDARLDVQLDREPYLRAMVPLSAEECLDQDAIAGFVAGSLDSVGLERVEAHVARCAVCQRVVADAAYGSIGTNANSSVTRRRSSDDLNLAETAQPAPSTPWPAALLRPGDVLAGKYRVARILGRGGMGTVFSAHHLELGHRVAIKILHRGGAAAAARFLREAQTCAQLANEHIVRAFDLGRLPGGAPYLVMEYLVGEDLARVVARGPLPIPRAVLYVTQACEALADAHAAGIVHRDLKPANLFLVQRPAGPPCIKVVDFGISKSIGGVAGEADSGLTSTGMILGSPSYMSPEQIRAKPIDERSDIWSLGVILHELLTGRPPFLAPSFSALSVAIATEPARCPSVSRAEVDPRLGQVVLRCLHKDPADRFASVRALALALAPFAAGSPQAERVPASLLAKARARLSARRALTAGALALGGAGIALTPIFATQSASKTKAQAPAIFSASPSAPESEPRSKEPVRYSTTSAAASAGLAPAASGVSVPSAQHSGVQPTRRAKLLSRPSAEPAPISKPDPTATPD